MPAFPWPFEQMIKYKKITTKPKQDNNNEKLNSERASSHCLYKCKRDSIKAGVGEIDVHLDRDLKIKAMHMGAVGIFVAFYVSRTIKIYVLSTFATTIMSGLLKFRIFLIYILSRTYIVSSNLFLIVIMLTLARCFFLNHTRFETYRSSK